ncbi:MAG: ribonuclease HII [Candidatus Pacebacteria bacterium]|nr:ribonuclease HII [Candidatus Paceibacterota bacterium]
MKATIGIDEVGRGPIAGPVAVGAFLIFDSSFEEEVRSFAIPLRDSKQLSKIQREKWFEQIEFWRTEGKCDFHVAMVSAGEIDTHGISKAIKKCLAETLEVLECDKECLILLDGSLHAPDQFNNQITIIKGDEKELAISLASIVAKVTRDRHMTKLAERYPKYGFEQHSGYGTSAHYEAIKKYGMTPLHRRSFLGSLIKSKNR